MPYIRRASRVMIEDILVPLGEELEVPGELNFAITTLVLSYLGLMPETGEWEHTGTPNYASFNEVMGALECVKQELYRRAVAPYEDLKAAENGDVYA